MFKGTLKQAKAVGVVRFFTGVPCKHGHLTHRYVSANGGCAKCIDIRSKNWRRGKFDPAVYPRVLKWRSKNKDRWRTQQRNYKARKRGAVGSYSHDDIISLLAVQQNKCAGPHCRIRLRSYHVDHRKPLTKDGSNRPSNLQLLCEKCNTSKGNKTMLEWKRYLRKCGHAF